jgi:hypothetical protein
MGYILQDVIDGGAGELLYTAKHNGQSRIRGWPEETL